MKKGGMGVLFGWIVHMKEEGEKEEQHGTKILSIRKELQKIAHLAIIIDYH